MNPQHALRQRPRYLFHLGTSFEGKLPLDDQAEFAAGYDLFASLLNQELLC